MLSATQLLRLKQAAHDALFCEADTKLPAELTIAQWALESGWGEHQPGNNCFGIKAYEGCYGIQSLLTTEVIGGNSEKVYRDFATFPSLTECFRKHAQLITAERPYAAAWSQYLQSKNVENLVRRIAPIYATALNYADRLLAIVHMEAVISTLAEFRSAMDSSPAPTPAA